MLMKSSASSPNSTASEGLPNSTRESENRKLSTYQYFAVYRFELDDIAEIIRYTVRKADLNHKDADYVPLLFENELRDHVMRERINEMGRRNLCARSVCTALA